MVPPGARSALAHPGADVHDASRMTRLQAACGWLAWQLTRSIGRTPLRLIGPRRVVAALAGALVLGALVILGFGYGQAQPEDTTVDLVMNGGLAQSDGWVRLRGRVFPLAEGPTEPPGEYGLLVDEQNALRAIVVRPPSAVEQGTSTTVTGRLVAAPVVVDEDLPIEATVFGTPPRVVDDRVLELDAAALAPRAVWWPVALGLVAIAIVIGIGLRVGYPFFRRTREVDVLARPLGPGERLPAAVGGHVRGRQIALDDPAEALLLSGRGTRGPILMLQLLARAGRAPAPVPIGGGLSRGTVGYVHTVSETIPALTVRAESVDAIILFARISERDRAASMVGVER
jgi:hypothetical protein